MLRIAFKNMPFLPQEGHVLERRRASSCYVPTLFRNRERERLLKKTDKNGRTADLCTNLEEGD